MIRLVIKKIEILAGVWLGKDVS